MKPGFMSGDILLNLDSEDEGQLFVSCAGGAATTAEFDFTPVDVPQDYFFFEVKVKGLTGGHSGDDINKKRANANKILARFYRNFRMTNSTPTDSTASRFSCGEVCSTII